MSNAPVPTKDRALFRRLSYLWATPGFRVSLWSELWIQPAQRNFDVGASGNSPPNSADDLQIAAGNVAILCPLLR